MKFSFQGFDQQGEFKKGVIEAPSRDLALLNLQNQGILVTQLKEKKEKEWLKTVFKPSLKDLAFFTRQISLLLDAQVPVREAIEALYRQTSHPILKATAYEIYNDLIGGLPLSQSFAKHSDLFSEYYVRMVQVAEISGNLASTFEYLANFLEKADALRKKTISVLTYPTLVLIIFFTVMSILFFWVVPSIAQLFQQANVEMPFLTRMFLEISQFLINYWIYWLAFLIGFAYLLSLYLKTPEGKEFLDQAILTIPIINQSFKNSYLAKISETLTMLIKGGVPLAESIQIASRVVENVHYQKALALTANNILKGGKISDYLKNFPELFPEDYVQILATAEKTGRIAQMSEKLADYYQSATERVLLSLTDILQPILILILGIGLGLMELSIMLPIFKLTKVVSAL